MLTESKNKEDALDDEFDRVVDQINKQNQEFGFYMFPTCFSAKIRYEIPSGNIKTLEKTSL